MTDNQDPRVDPLDLAEALAERERAAGVARVAAALAKPGAADCWDCGDRLSAARRAALPSAVRCTACQERRDFAALGRRAPRGPGALSLAPGDFQ